MSTGAKGDNMNSNQLTNLLGVGLGALHQAGVVGVVPSTKADWINTGASVLMAFLGYFSNK